MPSASVSVPIRLERQGKALAIVDPQEQHVKQTPKMVRLTPEQRVRLYQKLLERPDIQTRANLARFLKCSRAYITKVLGTE
jgi:hypothetical protein